MAYDEGSAERIEDYFRSREEPINAVAKKMFGGICYMVNGNMCVGILDDSLMSRVGKDGYESALAEPGTQQTIGNFKAMKGIVWIDAEAIADDARFGDWIERALAFVRTLPTK